VSAVRRLKRDEPAGSELSRYAERTYGELEASFDSWIAGFVADLQAEEGAEETAARFNSLLEQALQQADTFVKTLEQYAPQPGESVTGGGPGSQSPIQTDVGSATGGGPLELITGFFKPLVESGQIVWQEYRTATREKREGIVAELRALDWPSYYDIQPAT